MLIIGAKATHDAGVACIEDGSLRFSIELEKLGNGRRYSTLPDLTAALDILELEGIAPSDVDQLVIDGWHAGDARNLGEPVTLNLLAGGRSAVIPVGPYHEGRGSTADLRYEFQGLPLGLSGRSEGRYSSYAHVAGHIYSAYCTSPMAGRGHAAAVLVWDGAMFPRLYGVDPNTREIESLGPLFPVSGGTFGRFASNLPPFTDMKQNGDVLGVAGKAMAYAGLGSARPDLLQLLRETIANMNPFKVEADALLARRMTDSTDGSASYADLIATMQEYLGAELVSSLGERYRRDPRLRKYPCICLAGGCALNIKWNSRLRSCDLFDEVWIPPFPNDSGSAIGMACAEMVHRTGVYALDWDVFRGPKLVDSAAPQGWKRNACSPTELGELLYRSGDPVVVLTGRAELGPRALGHRSILAAAVKPEMKDLLNAIKGREEYRPVAPICLEDKAVEVFSPGSPDRFMLFDHGFRGDWQRRIPAVAHVDGTARLQTVSRESDLVLWTILESYERASGLPVLCNTSGNLRGCGFFPSATAAMDWGQVDRVWTEGSLYEKC